MSSFSWVSCADLKTSEIFLKRKKKVSVIRYSSYIVSHRCLRNFSQKLKLILCVYIFHQACLVTKALPNDFYLLMFYSYTPQRNIYKFRLFLEVKVIYMYIFIQIHTYNGHVVLIYDEISPHYDEKSMTMGNLLYRILFSYVEYIYHT